MLRDNMAVFQQEKDPLQGKQPHFLMFFSHDGGHIMYIKKFE